MEILVGSALTGLAEAPAPLPATTAGLDALLPGLELLAALDWAAVFAGTFVALAAGLGEVAGLLAAGLLAGELAAAFVVTGAALFAGCDCPAVGLAVFCEEDGENFSLIFCKKEV